MACGSTFAEISKIHAGSKNEKQIAAYVMQKAKEFGLEAKQDKFMSVVVRKPASNGVREPPNDLPPGTPRHGV